MRVKSDRNAQCERHGTSCWHLPWDGGLKECRKDLSKSDIYKTDNFLVLFLTPDHGDTDRKRAKQMLPPNGNRSPHYESSAGCWRSAIEMNIPTPTLPAGPCPDTPAYSRTVYARLVGCARVPVIRLVASSDQLQGGGPEKATRARSLPLQAGRRVPHRVQNDAYDASEGHPPRLRKCDLHGETPPQKKKQKKNKKKNTSDGAAQRLDSERVRGVQKRNFATHGQLRKALAGIRESRPSRARNVAVPTTAVGSRRLSLVFAATCARTGREIKLAWPVVPLLWRSHPEAEKSGGREEGNSGGFVRLAWPPRTDCARPMEPRLGKIARLDDFSRAHAHTLYRGQPSSQRLPFSAGSPFFVVAAFPMAHFRPTLLRSTARRSVPLRPVRARGARCPTSSQRSHTVERAVRPA
ncbi:hypothetical protein HPB49_020160 [Dermacentor silvarum]|uniref:Uncharacterized protein n=1 Tax=Dermacentor silvarum TaxID=543639 RepID=A0ACB8DKS7_DERSI|nr:hypothetical protein HPB49_020160 [Dermacentor silvarum]